MTLCFPGEEGCKESVSSSKESKSATESEAHHCLCSMVCHNLFIAFPTYKTSNPVIVIAETSHHFTTTIYPQVIISLDKPPII